MKTALLIVLLALSLVRHICASGAPMVNITTTDEGVSFRLQNINGRTEKKAKTLDDVEVWLREVFAEKEQGNMVLIYPDNRTLFKTVSDLLRRVRAAGVEQFAVTTIDPGDDVATHITGKTDKIMFTK